MDPWGHDIVNQFRDELSKGWDIRPTMAVTRANMNFAEIAEAVKEGKLEVDGSIVVDSSGEVRVTKVAVEPVWYLPGVAERFGVDEGTLRRTLFEHTGGSYPELITRPDLKIFLPPIGGLTVYIFGPPERVSDENVKLALRIHDECNGSDVFQSDNLTQGSTFLSEVDDHSAASTLRFANRLPDTKRKVRSAEAVIPPTSTLRGRRTLPASET
jgi:GTP cyclohydrolase II